MYSKRIAICLLSIAMLIFTVAGCNSIASQSNTEATAGTSATAVATDGTTGGDASTSQPTGEIVSTSSSSSAGGTDETGTSVTQSTSHSAITEQTSGKTTEQSSVSSTAKTTSATTVTVKQPTATTTTTTTVAPPQTTPLTELSDTQYYGLQQLTKLGNRHMLDFYAKLVSAIPGNETTIRANGLNAAQVKTVLLHYRADYPQHYWMKNTWSTTQYASYTDVRIDQNAAIKSNAAAFESKVQELLKGITANMSEYDRALMLHDRLIRNVTYDVSAPNANSAYGALVEGRAVCEGYARAYQYLLYRAGIQCLYITGYAGEPHAWNAVRLDGNYVLVDATWDDPIGVSDPDFVSHAFFGLTSAELARDHTPDSDGAYPQPVCTSTAYHYYRRNGKYLEQYSVDILASAIRASGQKTELYIGGDMNTFKNWFSQNAQDLANTLGRGFSTMIVGQELIITLS